MDPQSGFTCVTCKLLFRDADLQRDHYRSEWHRYNMKRQVVELPPITAEQFAEKASTFQKDKEIVKPVETNFYCDPCRKLLKSKNALENHNASKRHQELERNHNAQASAAPKQPLRQKPAPVPTPAPAPIPTSNKTNEAEMDVDNDDGNSSGWETDDGSDGEYDYDESQAIAIGSCLFCSITKPTMEGKMEHMRFHHGFMVPDTKYLVDEKGLLEYLGLKVGAGRCCIYCPDIKARYSTIADCQKHMRDKEHCKLRRDPQSMLEVAEFYDYTALYEELETSSSDVIYDDGWTLTLPSGAKIGHRSLMIYYRQYMKPFAGPSHIRGRTAIDRAKGILPALAWTNTTGRQAHQVARDLKYIDRYRRKFDMRCKDTSNKANRLFKTQGRIGDNRM